MLSLREQILACVDVDSVLLDIHVSRSELVIVEYTTVAALEPTKCSVWVVNPYPYIVLQQYTAIYYYIEQTISSPVKIRGLPFRATWRYVFRLVVRLLCVLNKYKM